MSMVLAITGGGSSAISMLLSVPGASRSILEAIVPYQQSALADFLGKEPEQACSAATARMMAMTAFERARRLTGDRDRRLLGIGCTAALTTDRSRRGRNRCFIASQSVRQTRETRLLLEKGKRTRPEEEALCARAIMSCIRVALSLEDRVTLSLEPGDDLETEAVTARPEWQALLTGEIKAAWQGTRSDRVIFPGTFSPMHEGHEEMIRVASEMLGQDVALEVSVFNVDKAPLDYLDMARRLDSIADKYPLVFTHAPTFLEKARLFPGSIFVVGSDTMQRIVSTRYYGGSTVERDRALTEIRDLGNRFLVFGRLAAGRFTALEDLALPAWIHEMCIAVPEERFRLDVSSTRLRSEKSRIDDTHR